MKSKFKNLAHSDGNSDHSYRYKKYLGQHFLKNKKILEKICRVAELTKRDIVLEVGPGLGHLTELLAQKAKRVIAIEKDRELIPILREKFRNYKNVEIVQGDILKSDPKLRMASELSEHSEHSDVNSEHLDRYNKIVANLPYYITSRFLRTFLSETKFRPKPMVLMVQKEVAERICAKPPHMNLLALSVQTYAKPEIICRVSKGQFSPPPKVDSAIIKITPIKVRGARGVMNPEKILSLARIAFQQKRKMLRHSLKNTLSTSNVNKFGGKRPEELSFKDWIEILRYN